MNKIFFIICLLLIMSMPFQNNAFASEETEQVSDQAAFDHWTCKEVAELGKKYGAEKKLPDSVVPGGKTCPRNEVAGCLLSIIEKLLEKCGKEGPEADPREDLDRIARLHEALKMDLSGGVNLGGLNVNFVAGYGLG